MKHLPAMGLGAAASALISVWLSFGASMAAGAQRHGLEAWPWLFAVSVVPGIVGSLFLSLAGPWVARNRWRFYLVPAAVAFMATALAGSAGAVVVETMSRDVARVNVAGYLTWCWAYAATLLPLTYPLALVVQTFIIVIPGDADPSDFKTLRLLVILRGLICLYVRHTCGSPESTAA